MKIFIKLKNKKKSLTGSSALKVKPSLFHSFQKQGQAARQFLERDLYPIFRHSHFGGASRNEKGGSHGKAISRTDLPAYFTSPRHAQSSPGFGGVTAGVINEVSRMLG